MTWFLDLHPAWTVVIVTAALIPTLLAVAAVCDWFERRQDARCEAWRRMYGAGLRRRQLDALEEVEP